MGSELCRARQAKYSSNNRCKNKAAVRKKQILIVMIQMETKSKIICTSQRGCFAGGRNCGESAQDAKRKKIFSSLTPKDRLQFFHAGISTELKSGRGPYFWSHYSTGTDKRAK